MNTPLILAYAIATLVNIMIHSAELVPFFLRATFDDLIRKRRLRDFRTIDLQSRTVLFGPEEAKRQKQRWEDEVQAQKHDIFDRINTIDFGRFAGFLERQLYFYAVLVPNMIGLVAAWFVMKAFFSWIRSKPGGQRAEDQPILSSTQGDDVVADLSGLFTFSQYYLFTLGTLFSLLAAIVVAEAARALAQLIVA